MSSIELIKWKRLFKGFMGHLKIISKKKYLKEEEEERKS